MPEEQSAALETVTFSLTRTEAINLVLFLDALHFCREIWQTLAHSLAAPFSAPDITACKEAVLAAMTRAEEGEPHAR